MKVFKKAVLPVLLAFIWISLSEFFRNQLAFNSFWTDHYKSLGLEFPSEPINGALWGLWSLVFAIVIYILASKFTQLQTAILSWVVGFVMMWIVIGNLSVLPINILVYAIPLSFLEVLGAAWIIFSFSKLNPK